ncbi:agmatine deiminase [Alkalimonas delamerensis]|uniref:Putative agmatine deiminase n=1 Tax=Alkalimonas delamerensis TaxID=265981 RepID=A0ABT9GQX0_9GAMM|nr:agmatine deiminase [Alkalimonas delamerensis]MDP4529367.1 agmatine deiminase [Alkalimonas delamerensis]
MARTLSTTPRQDGFYMPAEWQPHRQTWMVWPERTDNWRLGAKPAQAAFTQVIQAIARFEPVTVGVSANQYGNALVQLHSSPELAERIRVIELSSNDAWCRDTGPSFVVNGKGEVRGIDWTFNAWGGLNGGLYFPWHLDDQVASKVLSVEQQLRYRTEGFVLEGGGIHVDGEGTVLTTEECLLNPNRNPHLNRAQIEQILHDYLGTSKVIWLEQGIYLDETDGHIDNMACFVRPGEVLLAWTDDENDPQYARSQAALTVLENSTDAKGRAIKVHKLPLPAPIIAEPEEYASVDSVLHTIPREAHARLAGSYINFYLCNGGLIMPAFDDPNDQVAASILRNLFPEREVVLVPGREILLGGGNIHCITQQQPLA